MQSPSVTLIKLGISTEDSIVPYYPRVRDRDDVSVLKCNKSDVILLSRSDHINLEYYKTKKELNSLNLINNRRRLEQFESVIADKRWLDVGTGAGNILLLIPAAICVVAVEPQEEHRKNLDCKAYTTVEDVEENDFEVATLFHVLEHLKDPIDTLKEIKSKMVKGGKIIIEVPHARDFLLMSEEFKAFTFWSEHLILHTRESLKIFLKEAGFSNIVVRGYQRYSLANHLYWLQHGKPDGHIVWEHLETPELKRAYSDMLINIDKTDTLIAIANA